LQIRRDGKRWGKVWPILALLVTAAVVLCGCYGSQPKGWSGPTPADGRLFVGSLDGRLVGVNASDGSPLWLDEEAGTLGTSESGVAIYSSPAVGEELVYLAGYNGKVYAFVPETGALRWVYPREGNLGSSIAAGLAVAQGRVYFACSDGSIYALDAATGDKLWVSETESKIWSTPTVDGDTLYVGCFEKKLYALNTADGTKRWELEAGGAIVSPVLIDEGTLYFGAFDRYFYAVDAAGGSLRWRSEVMGGKWFWAKPVIYHGVVYAPNLDGKVYILDAASGAEVAAAVDLGNPISPAPVVVGDKVVLATEEGYVYALDTASYQKGSPLIDVKEESDNVAKSTSRRIYAPLSAAGGVVYIKAQTASEDALYAVDVAGRQLRWSRSLVKSEGD
jgi:outer membrane protein assembly factor BamB